MTDPRKLDDEAAALLDAPRSLRERVVDYARFFAIGLVAIAILGSVIGALGPTTILVAIGYTAVFTGALMLLAGGASGGGYANLGFGMMDRLVDNARRDGGGLGSDDVPLRRDMPSGRSSRRFGVSTGERRRDPMERLRKGLRPEKNPTAFWTVIGGFVYIGLGSLLVLA